MTTTSRSLGDRGQIALPMVVLTFAVAVVAAAVLMVMGRLLVDRSGAQAAADAAALAGAADGRAAAEAVAVSNGVDDFVFRRDGDAVVVAVTRGWASATARAGPVVDP